MRNAACVVVLGAVSLAMVAGCASKDPAPTRGVLSEPRVPNEYTTPTIYWEWILTSLDGAPLEGGDRTPSMAIWPDGRITGSGGVNSFSAAAEQAALDAGLFSIDPVMVTKMAGPEIPMREERRFFDALRRATRFELVDNTLSLRASTGEVARFRPTWQRPVSKEEQDRRLEEFIELLKRARGHESP